MLKRRPLTVQDMADVLGGNVRIMARAIEVLVKKGSVIKQKQGSRTYYLPSA
jgi:predicted transcriptional regulator